jgi:hypothetical protein
LDSFFLKFKNEITRIYSKRSEYVSLKKRFDLVIDREIASIRQNPYKYDELKENNSSSGLETNMSNLTLVKTNPIVKLKEDIIKQFVKFNINHLIRAHSKEGSCHDGETPVNINIKIIFK